MRRRRRRQSGKPSARSLQRQQVGAGLAAGFRILPRLLRKLGPTLARLTRSVRTKAPRFARGVRKRTKKLATKKNFKRVGKAAAIAAGTGALSGAAQYGVRKLLAGKKRKRIEEEEEAEE